VLALLAALERGRAGNSKAAPQAPPACPPAGGPSVSVGLTAHPPAWGRVRSWDVWQHPGFSAQARGGADAWASEKNRIISSATARGCV
jgi:hypothetical protein